MSVIFVVAASAILAGPVGAFFMSASGAWAAVALCRARSSPRMSFQLFEPARRLRGPRRSRCGSAPRSSSSRTHVRSCAAKEPSRSAWLGPATLDGVPENLALGVTLEEAVHASGRASLLRTFRNRGAASMRRDGQSPRRAVAIWAAVAVLLALAPSSVGSSPVRARTDVLAARSPSQAAATCRGLPACCRLHRRLLLVGDMTTFASFLAPPPW